MRIMFVGDISLGEYYPSFGHGPKTFAKSGDLFSKVKPIFEQADFVVGNLEAAITSIGLDESEPESVVLRGEPESAHQLAGAGFKILQVANNHTVQHGDDGFTDTIDSLAKLGIHSVGESDEDLVVIENKGKTYGFVAASDVPDNTYKQQNKYNRLNDDFINSLSNYVKKVDHLIVLLHWGLEASTTPLVYQRELADKLYDIGVRVIIGSHPHLFYEIEKKENFVIAYSLGNFVFDLCWDKRMLKSGILDVQFLDDDIAVKMWPVELRRNGCLPSPSGTFVDVFDKYISYDLGSKMDKQLLRKNIYFASRLFIGNTGLKLKFFLRKFLRLGENIFCKKQVG